MTPHLAQIIGGCIQVMFMFGSILPTFTLDRMGRRKTMMLGCGGLGVCMLMISALLSQADNVSNGQTFASASVAFFFLYMLIFGMSVNCVPWVYVPEILPLNARSQGTAIGISANWLWNFVVVRASLSTLYHTLITKKANTSQVMITPVVINRLQWKAYIIFMATNLAFVPIFYFFFPETSNLGLEEIDYIFTGEGSPVVIARKMQHALKMRRGSVGASSEQAGQPQLFAKEHRADAQLEHS